MSFPSLFSKNSRRNLRQEHLDVMTCYSEQQRELTGNNQRSRRRRSYRLFSRGGAKEQEDHKDHKKSLCFFGNLRRKVSSTPSYDEMKSKIYEEAEEWKDCPSVQVSHSMLNGISCRDSSTEPGFYGPSLFASNTCQRMPAAHLRTSTFSFTESCHPAISFTLHPPSTPNFDPAWKVVDTSSFIHEEPPPGDERLCRALNIGSEDAAVDDTLLGARRADVVSDHRSVPWSSILDPRPHVENTTSNGLTGNDNTRPIILDVASQIETLSKQIEDLHFTITTCEEILNALITVRVDGQIKRQIHKLTGNNSNAILPEQLLGGLSEMRASASPAKSSKSRDSLSSNDDAKSTSKKLSATLLGPLELSQACVLFGYSDLYSSAPEPVNKCRVNYPQADFMTPSMKLDSTSNTSTTESTGQLSVKHTASWEPDREHLVAVCGDMWSTQPVVQQNSLESVGSNRAPPIPVKSGKRLVGRKTRPVVMKLSIPS